MSDSKVLSKAGSLASLFTLALTVIKWASGFAIVFFSTLPFDYSFSELASIDIVEFAFLLLIFYITVFHSEELLSKKKIWKQVTLAGYTLLGLLFLKFIYLEVVSLSVSCKLSFPQNDDLIKALLHFVYLYIYTLSASAIGLHVRTNCLLNANMLKVIYHIRIDCLVPLILASRNEKVKEKQLLAEVKYHLKNILTHCARLINQFSYEGTKKSDFFPKAYILYSTEAFSEELNLLESFNLFRQDMPLDTEIAKKVMRGGGRLFTENLSPEEKAKFNLKGTRRELNTSIMYPLYLPYEGKDKRNKFRTYGVLIIENDQKLPFGEETWKYFLEYLQNLFTCLLCRYDDILSINPWDLPDISSGTIDLLNDDES